MIFSCVFVFASCSLAPNSDPSKAAEALEEADYTVYKIDNEIALKFYLPESINNCIAFISANKGDDSISIFYFDTKSNAKESWKAYQNNIKELQEIAEKSGQKIIAKQSGKMFYCGTEQAIKDAQ